jgi:dihydroorotase-like cyclic amidohydrolase
LISQSQKYQRRLHIWHLSPEIEAELLRQDKPSWVTAELTPQQLLLNTEAYSQIGTLVSNKEAIAVGYDADLILVDLNNYRPVLREELQTKCGQSLFEGWNLTGWTQVTIAGGQIANERGKFNTQVRGKALSFG